MKDLRERTIRGGFAKIGAQASSFVLRLGTLMVLARLLEPADFGVVGMVTAITGVLSLFKEFGLSTATVQRTTISNNQISTLFWINLLVGGLLYVLAIAVAPLAVSFYREPRLFLVMAVLASGFVFNAAGVQHSALLQRQMRFTALSVIEIVSLVISSTISIAVAVRGYGYWALVAWSTTLPLVSTLLTWFQTGWIPGVPRRQTGLRSMMRFGSIVTLNSLVVYVAYNLDKILLGRFWGAELVGIYGRAYQLITLPMDNLHAAASGVAFPVLSRLQDDPIKLRNYFLRGYSLLLALAIPVTVASALFADDLIFVFLGPKWSGAVPILRLLAPAIIVFAVINPTGWLLVALGMVGRSLRIALVIAPIVLTGYILGLPYGPTGVAFGYSAAMTLWVVPHLLWCFRGTGVSSRDALLVVSCPLISGIAGASVAFGILAVAGPFLSALGRLALGSTILFVVYASVLLFVTGQRAFYLDLLRHLKPRSTEKAVVFP